MLFLKQSDFMTSHTDAITNLLSSYKGVTTLFLEDIVRNVDIGVLSLGRFSLLESLANHLINSISEPESVKAASVVITKLDILDGDGRLGCSMTKTK